MKEIVNFQLRKVSSGNEKLIETSGIKTQMEVESEAKEYFRSGDVIFEELGAGMIRCGICQIACSRLVSHLNKNEKCSRSFSMPGFKKEYSKYRHRIRIRKHEDK